MEKILVVKKDALPDEWIQKKLSLKMEFNDFEANLNYNNFLWIKRKNAEKNFSYKQIIPYSIICRENNIGVYMRHGREKRLENLYSIGIGGHIDFSDNKKNVKETIKTGLLRELNEEFINFDENKSNIKFLGIINEEITEVGKVHFGLVFLIITNQKNLISGDELKNFSWVPTNQVLNCKLEYWSILAYNLLKK